MKQQTEMHPILAKFHEAKEAGFEWADDAIKLFDEQIASENLSYYTKRARFSTAIGVGFFWGNSWSKWNLIYESLKKQGL